MKSFIGFFAENYRKCSKFAFECRWFFVFATGIFALMFLIGFIFPVFFREEIFNMIRLLILEVEGKSSFELVVFIFLNNLKASFFAMILGIFLGVLPFVTTVVNGYLLGFVSREAVATNGLLTMWRLLPHGIFELPAIIFSIGIGFKLGVSVFSKLAGKKKGFGYVFREGLRFFVFVILPLLIVAGIIEGVLIGISR